MQTRSKTRALLLACLEKPALIHSHHENSPLYSNTIDFDEASSEWNCNKKRVGQMYVYVCGAITATGKTCRKLPLIGHDHCNLHVNK
jgi:hypothetical protein